MLRDLTPAHSAVEDVAARGHAATVARELARMPGVEVLNDVVFTQVCASLGSTWHGQTVLRG